MLACLLDYIMRTCSLRILSQLEGDGYQRTPAVTTEHIIRIFTKTTNRVALCTEYLKRMSRCPTWQSRLRYLLVLLSVCKKLSMYQQVLHTNMPVLTHNL